MIELKIKNSKSNLNVSRLKPRIEALSQRKFELPNLERKGNYILIDTTVVKHIDAITSANNLDKSIASGVLNPYKAQKYCNMLPCEEKWAKSYYMTKNYQTAEMAMKGGENE